MGCDADAARRELAKVLQSTGFARNERLAAFLRFVVEQHLEGRDAEIKESTIDVEVFPPRHGPRSEARFDRA